MRLPDPPVVGERQISNHDCVSASLAAAFGWVGHPDTVAQVAAWETAQGWDQSTGITIEHAASYCANAGVAYDWDDGDIPITQYLPAALSNAWPVLGFHQCDGNANPVPVGATNIAHCRLFYGNDLGYQTMNPWPPARELVDQAAMEAADLRVHLAIHIPVPGGKRKMNPFFAAHLILTLIFGHGYSADQLNQVAGDVAATDELAALYKWTGMATNGGEIDLVTRLSHLRQDGNSTPDHIHPSSPATIPVTVPAHEHSVTGTAK